MRWAIKDKRTQMTAVELGADEQDPLYLQLVSSGKIKKLTDTSYAIFSMEAVNGQGQVANKGDFVKVNPEGEVHPNTREYFLEHHKHIDGHSYEQITFPVRVWCAGDEIGEELEYLLKTGQLLLNESSETKFFNAFLWGTDLSAAKDAYLVMYSVLKDQAGQITDISFNFVEHEEFHKTYSFIEAE